MFMRRKWRESYRETGSSEWGNFSADIRCRSSAEFPGTAHRLGSLPAASWSLTSKRHRCVKMHPFLMSTGVWSPIPLGPYLLLTLFRGNVKLKRLLLCETGSWSPHQALVSQGSKESLTSCTPRSTCPHSHRLLWCCIIRGYFHNWVCRDPLLCKLKLHSQNFIFHISKCSFRCSGSFGANHHVGSCVG